MGTDVERAAVNDNDLHWRLRGPDEDDLVWLDYDGPGCRRLFNLGDKAAVHGAFADAACEVDYGTAPPGTEKPDMPWALIVEGEGLNFAWRGEGPFEDLPLGPRERVCEELVEWLVQLDEP
jgi:hypothetical protein